VGALLTFKNEGKIRHIGLSNQRRSTHREAQRSRDRVGAEHRATCRPVAPTAAGRRDQPGRQLHPAGSRSRRTAGRPDDPLQRCRQPADATPSQAWLLKQSPVMLPIPGTSKVAHWRTSPPPDTLSDEVRDTNGCRAR
jgi:aryl-alcohol dehydrogenase-like predicted oxidoreductase